MENKTAVDIAKQLKRIADALDKQNVLSESNQKRNIKVNKLEEKKLRSQLRESISNSEEVFRTSPKLED